MKNLVQEWATARMQEKLDGSLVILHCVDGGWPRGEQRPPDGSRIDEAREHWRKT